jgi:CubicO group peptidase (beta-lactamase class C family)
VTQVQGECAPRFALVREALEKSFAAGEEVGASFAAYLDGELVVDLWGGHADASRSRPWLRDTLVNVFSTTKAPAALVLHMLAERGSLDLDAPVAKYWPEFAQGGKEALPVRHLLSHRAGLAALRTQLPTEALWDWRRMTEALAAETPWWEPGTESGYHAMSYGFLVGEVARRASGRSLGAYFRDEVARPLGADFWIGLPASEDPRVAELVPPSPAELAAAGPGAAPAPGSLLAQVMGNPPLAPATANRTEWRRAEIPAANGHGNARSVARVMAALACGGSLGGVRVLGAEALARATQEEWQGQDLVLGVPMRWGLGFMLASDTLPLSPTGRAFGHGGWGGSLGIADPNARLAWAYVMNKMSAGTLGDTRGFRLAQALYAGL